MYLSSRHRFPRAILLPLLLLRSACGAPSDATSRPDSGAATPVLDAPIPSVTASAPTEATAAEIARPWQGAWVVRDTEFTGSVQAWSVREDHVAVYDAARRALWEGRIAWPSPCHVTRTQSIDGGPDATIATTNTFVFAPDGLHVGLGTVAGGFQRGSRVTACVGDHVYTFDTRTRECQRWNETMIGSPLTPDTECAIDTSLGTPALVLRQRTSSGRRSLPRSTP